MAVWSETLAGHSNGTAQAYTPASGVVAILLSASGVTGAFSGASPAYGLAVKAQFSPDGTNYSDPKSVQDLGIAFEVVPPPLGAANGFVTLQTGAARSVKLTVVNNSDLQIAYTLNAQ